MTTQTTHPELRNLELFNTRIALESGVLDSFPDTVKRLMPSMSAAVRNFMSGFMVVLSDAKGSTGPQYAARAYEDATRVMDKHKFVNLMELRAYIPEGFKGDLNAYAAILLQAQEHTNQVVGAVITPYNVFLSKLISDTGAVKETKLQLTSLNQIKRTRETFSSEMSGFFPNGSTVSYCKIGDVFGRNEDIVNLGETLKNIHDYFDTKKPVQVREAVTHCSDLLEVLSNNAQEGGLKDISAQALRTLGEATLEVAREVEFFSIVNYQVNTLLTVMGENTSAWMRALKK